LLGSDGLKIVKDLKEKGIRWIELQFTDLAGYLHSTTVPIREIDEDALERGLGQLDGSSVEGFTTIDESDLVLRPDPSTAAILPWNSKRARMICDVYMSFGRGRFPKDPRYIAERAMAYAAENGYRAFFGPEVEFMILNGIEVDIFTPFFGTGYRIHSFEVSKTDGGNSRVINVENFQKIKKAYHTPPPMDKLQAIRDEIAEYLEDYFGFKIEAHHHEVAAFGQVEINFRFSDLKRTADNVMTLKYVARNVAAKYGLTATFMPKVVYGDNGNGMHTHVSLWDTGTGRNLFYDPDDDYAELSQLGRYFIGGLLEHGRALAALVAPTTNSYRRLVPGYEAPVYLVWSRANRSAAVRVPVYHRGDEKGKRIEYRPPDPSANPYLAFAAILAAGLDGIRRKIDPGDPVDKNVYDMTPEERRRHGIKELPRSLDEALDELESDMEFLRPIFTREALETYIEIKRKEASQVRLYPSPIEVYMYYNI
jgi:glutamine synthetase